MFPGLFQLLPFLIVTAIFMITAYFMSKNKGLSPLKYTLIAAIPVIGYFVIPVILSKENRYTADRLDRLEKTLGEKHE